MQGMLRGFRQGKALASKLMQEMSALRCLTTSVPVLQIRNSVETAVAEKMAAINGEAFNFASYMKERAQLVNEALDKSVPLQYPEIINESMRWASTRLF